MGTIPGVTQGSATGLGSPNGGKAVALKVFQRQEPVGQFRLDFHEVGRVEIGLYDIVELLPFHYRPGVPQVRVYRSARHPGDSRGIREALGKTLPGVVVGADVDIIQGFPLMTSDKIQRGSGVGRRLDRKVAEIGGINRGLEQRVYIGHAPTGLDRTIYLLAIDQKVVGSRPRSRIPRGGKAHGKLDRGAGGDSPGGRKGHGPQFRIRVVFLEDLTHPGQDRPRPKVPVSQVFPTDGL